MTRQQDLFTDLPRGEQLAALRRIELDAWQRNSTKVSGKMQKAVLRAIDDHEGGRGCFATQSTIASEIGCSEVTVSRAVAALIDRDLITKERPNHWSPNHHRINWTAVSLLGRSIVDRVTGGSTPPSVTATAAAASVDRSKAAEPGKVVSTGTSDVSRHHCDVSTDHSDASRHQRDVSDASHIRPGAVTMTGPRHHSDIRNDHLNAQRTDHLTAPWVAVAATMFRWGLKSATQACQAASGRGWSPEYAAELFREAGGDREPERWEPGQLANWLTGRTPPPFDEAEANRRRTYRDQMQAIEADKIRLSVMIDGEDRGVPPWAIAGVTFGKLKAAGFERLATTDERDGAKRLAEHRKAVPA